jgi:hypothetical protein
MLLAVPPFHDHMGPMRKRDADHPIDMMHIDASDIVPRVRIIKQREVPQVPPFESCFSVRFWILVFFHVPHLYEIKSNLIPD